MNSSNDNPSFCQSVDIDEIDEFSAISSEFENLDFHKLPLEEVAQNLQSTSTQVRINALEVLEVSHAEELIIHNSWTQIRQLLQDIFRVQQKNEKYPFLVLRILRRFLLFYDAPKIICEGFTTLTESLSFFIDAVNSKDKLTLTDQDLSEDMKSISLPQTSSSENVGTNLSIEILIKSVWLLIEVQKAMSRKWARFNENRLQEIICSFLNFLSTSLINEEAKLSAMEIISVLNPSASWCRPWFHGATGRFLFCSALRRQKKLLSYITDIVLNKMKMSEMDSKVQWAEISTKSYPLLKKKEGMINKKKDTELNAESINLFRKKSRTPENGSIRMKESHVSHSSLIAQKAATVAKEKNMLLMSRLEMKREERWIINGISLEVVELATFCHCFSFITYIIQYRVGRSLFPVNTNSRKRHLTVQDLVSSMITYVENYAKGKYTIPETDHYQYKQHLLKLLEILKIVQTEMHSKINTHRSTLER